jgi:hypothetical protein
LTLVVSWARVGLAHKTAVNIKSPNMMKYRFIGCPPDRTFMTV